mmetsp:Transcript_53615/g.160496  ORF Transcript_53615/g.160496 Transcript_53615/m.160496 type:complete len:228 (-) Transcript_53615:490-1173(-)
MQAEKNPAVVVVLLVPSYDLRPSRIGIHRERGGDRLLPRYVRTHDGISRHHAPGPDPRKSSVRESSVRRLRSRSGPLASLPGDRMASPLGAPPSSSDPHGGIHRAARTVGVRGGGGADAHGRPEGGAGEEGAGGAGEGRGVDPHRGRGRGRGGGGDAGIGSRAGGGIAHRCGGGGRERARRRRGRQGRRRRGGGGGGSGLFTRPRSRRRRRGRRLDRICRRHRRGGR